MKTLKKALSLFCSISMMLSAFAALSINASASTTEPTIKVEILDNSGNKITDGTKLNVGDTITVKYSYEGFDKLNYSDDEGAGGKMTSLQFKGIIPGLSTTATDGYFQKAGGVTKLISHAVTGSPNYKVNATGDAEFVTSIVFADEGDAPMTPSGELYSVKIKVKKAIDKDLVFDFASQDDYASYYYVSQMIDWAMDPTTATKYTDIKFESATLAGPAIEEDKPVVMEEAVAGNEMKGSDGKMWKTALTKISFKGVENPVVKLAKDGVDSGKPYELPADVKGGTTDIIGIIRYAAGEKGTFVLSVFDGETSETSIASTTYVAK